MHNLLALKIDLEALVYNYNFLRQKVAPGVCGAVVKANSYGLGAIPIALALSKAGCKHMFVATLQEALELRPFLPDHSLILLNGFQKGEEEACAHGNFTPALYNIEEIALWNDYAKKHNVILPVVLQVESGLGRLGLSEKEMLHLSQVPDLLEHLSIDFIMTHLSCPEEPHNPYNILQHKRFYTLLSSIPAFSSVKTSLANSAGIFLGKKYHGNLARPGAALYGINPTPLFPNPMRPIIYFTSKILHVKHVAKDEKVGYGITYTTSKEERHAVVAGGYADGYSRMLSNKGICYVQGYPAPVVGRVSMDSFVIDITSVPECYHLIGTDVEIIGAHSLIDTVASHAGTIAYEVITRLSHRIKRIYT